MKPTHLAIESALFSLIFTSWDLGLISIHKSECLLSSLCLLLAGGKCCQRLRHASTRKGEILKQFLSKTDTVVGFQSKLLSCGEIGSLCAFVSALWLFLRKYSATDSSCAYGYRVIGNDYEI